MSNKDNLGDRMKNHENISRHHLIKRMPVIIRVDGNSFHTYTKSFNRPFDNRIIRTMIESATKVAERISGFKLGYIQSDEASFLLTDYDNLLTQPCFDNNLNKLVSISGSTMSVFFNDIISKDKIDRDLAVFDSRAFNVPREEVSNYFLWRQKDWNRNSLQMYARSIFSHKELHNKNSSEIHEMLHTEGKNWSKDLDGTLKNGTFLVKTDKGIIERTDILPNYKSVNEVVDPLINLD